jgi:hypothetical protein
MAPPMALRLQVYETRLLRSDSARGHQAGALGMSQRVSYA